MSTIVASVSQADSATTTSSPFAFNADDVIIGTVANGATPPSQFCQVQLQLSGDSGVTWKAVETKWAGGEASFTYVVKFELADYAGAIAQSYGYSAWTQYRLYFAGNVGAAVTIAASDADPIECPIVVLTGTTSTSGGGIASWSPPEGGPIIITGLQVLGLVNSTGAANLSVGVAANAATSATNLINAQAIGSAANTAIFSGAGTSATVGAILTGTQAVTFTGSANSSGFSGKAFIQYVKP